MSGNFGLEWFRLPRRRRWYLVAHDHLAGFVDAPELPGGRYTWRCGARTGGRRSLLEAQVEVEIAWREQTGHWD